MVGVSENIGDVLGVSGRNLRVGGRGSVRAQGSTARGVRMCGTSKRRAAGSSKSGKTTTTTRQPRTAQVSLLTDTEAEMSVSEDGAQCDQKDANDRWCDSSGDKTGNWGFVRPDRASIATKGAAVADQKVSANPSKEHFNLAERCIVYRRDHRPGLCVAH